MSESTATVAIIPARGGSKRIAGKNVREFAGQPIIAWPIQAALESGLFDQVIVSTDDDEIARVAERHGARVPFKRPDPLADDHTGTLPVIAHAVQWLTDNQQSPDTVCCLYATAPFATAANLKRGYQRLARGDCSYAFAVTSYAFPIQRAVKLDANDRVSMFDADNEQMRSQDLVPAFHDAGQFYWASAATFATQQPVFTGHSAGILIDRHLVQDIDTEEDWLMAELMFQALQSRGLVASGQPNPKQ